MKHLLAVLGTFVIALVWATPAQATFNFNYCQYLPQLCPTPTPTPTITPSPTPTASPTPTPISTPTATPTPVLTLEPLVEPTPEPTVEPTLVPIRAKKLPATGSNAWMFGIAGLAVGGALYVVSKVKK